nr:hypothetical protein [Tanacetum cinerariifolium]
MKLPVIHHPNREKTCAELLAEEHEANINTQPFQYYVVHQPPQEEISMEFLQEKRNQIDSVKTFLRKFNRISFYKMPKVLSLAWETILKIKLTFEDKHCQPKDILKLFRRLHNDVQNIHEELAVYINTPSWDCPTLCYNDDDDEGCTIAITPKEPDNSLNFTTFSNILFDSDYDFSSSDDQSFYDEDISKKIYSNPLFDEEIISIKIDSYHFNTESDLIESLLNHDSSIISSSSKSDSLFDEFAGELTLLKSIPPGINETNCDPEEETRLIKRLFDSFMEEIDLSFTPDDPMPPGIKEDDYNSERYILILEELLSNDSLSLPENESFHFDIPSSSRPPAKPPDGNLGILNVKVMGDISEHKFPMPRIMLTQPTLVPNQEKSPKLLPHQGHEAFQPSTECPMMIYGRNTPILDSNKIKETKDVISLIKGQGKWRVKMEVLNSLTTEAQLAHIQFVFKYKIENPILFLLQAQFQSFDSIFHIPPRWDMTRQRNRIIHDLKSVETGFPATIFNDKLTSEVAFSCETTISSLDDNKIEFRISFDEFDDEDYTVIFDKNSFSYKIIYVDDLKTDSENDNDTVNMPSFPSPEPTYTDADIADFEELLGRIYKKGVHRVHVFDFERLIDLMYEGLSGQMLMKHMDAQGQSVFTSRAWRRLFEVRVPLVHELILEFFSTFRFGEAILDLDTAGALQFQLGGDRRRMS